VGKKPNRFFNKDDTIYMCKAMVGRGNLEPTFFSPQNDGDGMSDIIDEDKKYGTFQPINGEYFTYKVMNEDEEMNEKQITKSIQKAYRRIAVRTNLKFRKARSDEQPDFRIEFRTVDTDPEEHLTSGTLMYHYYPINNIANSLRGLCVVNKQFYWTTHGESLSMNIIDPDNYPDPETKWKGKTYDFDQVYTHEVLHGLGLPHSKHTGNVMSSNYGIMAEWLSEEDLSRVYAKYGKREMSEGKLARWIKWIKGASEREY